MEKITISNRIAHLSAAEQRLYHALPLVLLGDAEPPAITVSLTDVWFEDRLGDWVVAYRLGLQQETRIVVSEIRIFPAGGARTPGDGRWSADVLGCRAPVPPGGIKARTVLRRIRLRSFERELSTLLGKLPGLGWKFRAPNVPTGGGTRGRKLNVLRYARVAVTYAARFEEGSARPTADVARQLKMTPAAARAAVAKARKLGLLTTTARGERNGHVTPQAIKIVNQARKGRK